MSWIIDLIKGLANLRKIIDLIKAVIDYFKKPKA